MDIPEPEAPDPVFEEKLIRALLLGGLSMLVAGALATVTVVAVMISYNFNFLEWME